MPEGGLEHSAPSGFLTERPAQHEDGDECRRDQIELRGIVVLEPPDAEHLRQSDGADADKRRDEQRDPIQVPRDAPTAEPPNPGCAHLGIQQRNQESRDRRSERGHVLQR